MSGNFISIKTNFPQVISRLNWLGEEVGNKAMARALNATMQQAKPKMASQISKEFRVSVSEAKARIDITRATAKNGGVRLQAEMSARNKAKGRSMNLIAFVEKVVTFAQARKRMKAGEGGVQTLRRGGQVQKALQLRFQIKRTGVKQMIKGAFIGNKGRTVFIRKGKERMPIEGVSTIDIPQMFNTKRINSVVRETMLARFEANFDRELRAVLKGFAK